MATFSTVWEERNELGCTRSGQCAVVALAVATDCGYGVARDAINLHAAHQGIKIKRTGHIRTYYENAYSWILSAIGLKMELVPLSEWAPYGRTVNAMNARGLKALGITHGFIRTPGHIMGIANGATQDWTKPNTKRMVIDLFRIVRK